jgi:perosamine synthetase
MNFFRTLPPAASPIYVNDIVNGIRAIFVGQKECLRLSGEIKQYFNTKYCFFVSSGKTALYCILKALHSLNPDKNEVLIPAFNCYSVPSAIVKADCSIRLCDIDPNTLDFNKEQLAEELSDSKRLLCVIPTHLFGLEADVSSVCRLINDESVFVVEDAAQSMGNGSPEAWSGLSGDVGFFSLGRGKSFSAYEGGIIVTNNDKIGEAIADIFNNIPEYSLFQTIKLIVNSIAVTALSNPFLFGIPKRIPFLKIGETVFEHSFPIYRMSSFQAGLSRNWMKKLHEFIGQRRNNTKYWASFFKEHNDTEIYSFVNSNDSVSGLLRFSVVILDDKKRKFILSESEKYGLGISRTYPESLDNLEELKPYKPVKCPQAEKIAKTIVTLPVHPYLNKRDIKRIKAIFINMESRLQF